MMNQKAKIQWQKTCPVCFERDSSEAAAGCLASVAAKLVKTAIENHIYMRVEINHRRQIWDILVRFCQSMNLP